MLKSIYLNRAIDIDYLKGGLNKYTRTPSPLKIYDKSNEN